MLIQRIKEERIQSMKSKNALKTKLLTTLLSEASLPGLNDGKRESTDAEVIAVVQKFLKNIQETLKVVEKDNLTKLADLAGETTILETFLPVQLTEDEIQDIASNFLVTADNPNMGAFMKYMKTNFNGQYDGKVASFVAKNTF